MHLVGDTSGAHLAHVHVYHDGGRVTLDWEVRNAPPVRWRVLPSYEGYAENAEPPGDNGQARVNEGEDTHFSEPGGRTAYYTIFAQEQDGSWQRQIEAKARPHDLLHWTHLDAEHLVEAEADPSRNSKPATPALRFGMGKPVSYMPLRPHDLDHWLRLEGM